MTSTPLTSAPGPKLQFPLNQDIRISEQYRVCFRWTESGAEDVEIVDDH
jgi:toxin HigB-1